MKQWNVRKKSYRRLGVSDNIEIREYPPQRRTVSIGKKLFSLHFPYTIFMGVWGYWDEWEECFGRVSDACLSVCFAKKKITSMYDVVYHPVLPHVETDNGLSICLSGMNYESDNLGCFVQDYWCSKFSSFSSGHCSYGSRSALSINFGRLASWQRLSSEQVTEQLCYGPRLFKSFVNHAEKGYYHDDLKFLKSIRKKPNRTDKYHMKQAGMNSVGDCIIADLYD